jgi:hypothetical protein
MNSPRGIDVSWVAVDAAGRLGVFTTAGEGPVPESALSVSAAADEVVCRLPVLGGHELLIKYLRPDDFVAFAERGLYAYDWSDAHRPRGDCTGCYELVAKPVRPVSIGELSPNFRVPFDATVISGASFGQSRVSQAVLPPNNSFERTREG